MLSIRPVNIYIKNQINLLTINDWHQTFDTILHKKYKLLLTG